MGPHPPPPAHPTPLLFPRTKAARRLYLWGASETGIVEVADFRGLASRGYVFEPVGPNTTPIEQDLSEFFEVSALSSLPAEEALVRKISIRRA